MKSTLTELQSADVLTLHAVIKELKSFGYSQSQLSKLVGVSKATMSQYATKSRKPVGLNKLLLLYKLLDCETSCACCNKKVQDIVCVPGIDESTTLVTYYG